MDFKSSRKKRKPKGLLRSWQEHTIQAKAGITMYRVIDLNNIRTAMALLPRPVNPQVLLSWNGLLNAVSIVPHRLTVFVPGNVFPDPDDDSGRSSGDSPESDDNDDFGPPAPIPPGGMVLKLNAIRKGMLEIEGSLNADTGRDWNYMKNSQGDLGTVNIWQ